MSVSITARFHRHPTKPTTKNCYRYEEDDREGAIRSLYLRQDHVDEAFGEHPEAITVEITQLKPSTHA